MWGGPHTTRPRLIPKKKINYLKYPTLGETFFFHKTRVPPIFCRIPTLTVNPCHAVKVNFYHFGTMYYCPSEKLCCRSSGMNSSCVCWTYRQFFGMVLGHYWTLKDIISSSTEKPPILHQNFGACYWMLCFRICYRHLNTIHYSYAINHDELILRSIRLPIRCRSLLFLSPNCILL